jgi:hypothetical protein
MAYFLTITFIAIMMYGVFSSCNVFSELKGRINVN